MADNQQMKLISRGASAWNIWRQQNPQEPIDLSNSSFTFPMDDCPDLTGIDLHDADLTNTYICGPDRNWPGDTAPTFDHADLTGANLGGATLFRTSFENSNLYSTNLSSSSIFSVSFKGADLRRSIWRASKVERISLAESQLLEADFRSAIVRECDIYGVGAWNVLVDENTQMKDLRMDALTVDEIELAQFLYVVVHNERLRRVLDTITAKVVLILGRFTEERLDILNGIRETLRNRGYVPVLFDFEKPSSRDLTETISLLAHMARFVVADITDARSIPQELQAIVPNLPSVPVQPIICAHAEEYTMFEHFQRYPWVLPIYTYKDEEDLLEGSGFKIITPAERILERSAALRAKNRS